MTLNLTHVISQHLQEQRGKKFTAREIAYWVFENYPEACRRKQKRSAAKVSPLDNDAALIQQIAAEIGSQRPNLQKKVPQIKTTEGRPRKYYFTEDSDRVAIDHAERNSHFSVSKGNAPPLKEADLYPLVSEFLGTELKVYSKRIEEKRSRNARGPGGNKWLYPDLVGLEDLSADWLREIKDSVQQYADKRTRLWSFEVKILINRSNVREAFFQTVSNSSWANFGYLVASDVEGADTLKELRILTSLHGIGFIRLDAENPSESQIMIPAKGRREIDWDTANRLCDENKDFLDYIKQIRQFYQTGEIRGADWGVSDK